MLSAVAASLRQRPHERHVVDLLQRALPPAQRRRAAAEHDHRRVVRLRGGHRAHPVGHARAGGQRAHARLARHLRPALGGERGRGLVAHVHDLDPLLAAAVVDREQVPARQREQLAHAVRLQPPRDQPPAVEGLGSCALSVLIPRDSIRSPLGRDVYGRYAGAGAQMPGVGFEPTCPLQAVDFKSTAYTDSATRARAESSLCERPCE